MVHNRVKVNVRFIIEISDHNGSCNNNKCKYYTCEYSQRIYVREKDIIKGKNMRIVGLNKQEKYLPLPRINEGDTHNCMLSYDCDDNDLDRHDYKIIMKEITKC